MEEEQEQQRRTRGMAALTGDACAAQLWAALASTRRGRRLGGAPVHAAAAAGPCRRLLCSPVLLSSCSLQLVDQQADHRQGPRLRADQHRCVRGLAAARRQQQGQQRIVGQTSWLQRPCRLAARARAPAPTNPPSLSLSLSVFSSTAGHVDESGLYAGSFTTFALCGQLRIKVRSGEREARQAAQHESSLADGAAGQLQAGASLTPLPPPPANIPSNPPTSPPTLAQGEADSALDHLWAAKRADIGQ